MLTEKNIVYLKFHPLACKNAFTKQEKRIFSYVMLFMQSSLIILYYFFGGDLQSGFRVNFNFSPFLIHFSSHPKKTLTQISLSFNLQVLNEKQKQGRKS
jgi:hypothetical protein